LPSSIPGALGSGDCARDSDIYGDYLKCRPKEHAEIQVYDARQFWTWRTGDREGFWAELSCDSADRVEIDRCFLELLRRINASNISALGSWSATPVGWRTGHREVARN
jgi:hypothetical protein